MAEKFLTQEQLSVFCSSLAMLLRSGASLSEVSSLFEEDGMDTALRQASTEISLSVAAGEPFSAAAEKTGVFPEYALSVFSTAELSGRLDEALDRLADHYDRQSALYDRLRSTLTYPAVLMLMMCGVLAAVTGFFMVSNAGYAIFTQGNGLSTLPISCCVLGGIKMAGGKGTAIHILLGVLIMRIISQMMTAMFLPADRVNLITGILLIVVLLIDRFTSTKNADE